MGQCLGGGGGSNLTSTDQVRETGHFLILTDQVEEMG